MIWAAAISRKLMPFVSAQASASLIEDEAYASLLLELLWELADDARAEHVGHVQNLPVYLLVSRDVRRPITFQAGLRFGGRQVQMLTHHPLHLGARPVLRVRLAQERRDLIRVGEPAPVRVRHLGRVIRLGGGDHFGGGGDVVFPEFAHGILAGGLLRRIALILRGRSRRRPRRRSVARRGWKAK